MMIKYTNGEDSDFIRLCQLLDDNLDEMVGGKKQRAEYSQYNKLDHIHDVMIAYVDDIPAGCAAFKHYGPGTAEVKRVFVKKEYRGLGISKMLMEQIEQKAREKGYEQLILETGKPLKEAIGLYTKIGYNIIMNYGQYKDMPLSVCMSKNILV